MRKSKRQREPLYFCAKVISQKHTDSEFRIPKSVFRTVCQIQFQHPISGSQSHFRRYIKIILIDPLIDPETPLTGSLNPMVGLWTPLADLQTPLPCPFTFYTGPWSPLAGLWAGLFTPLNPEVGLQIDGWTNGIAHYSTGLLRPLPCNHLKHHNSKARGPLT